jgi:hypothetical protein
MLRRKPCLELQGCRLRSSVPRAGYPPVRWTRSSRRSRKASTWARYFFTACFFHLPSLRLVKNLFYSGFCSVARFKSHSSCPCSRLLFRESFRKLQPGWPFAGLSLNWSRSRAGIASYHSLGATNKSSCSWRVAACSCIDRRRWRPGMLNLRSLYSSSSPLSNQTMCPKAVVMSWIFLLYARSFYAQSRGEWVPFIMKHLCISSSMVAG